MGNIWEKIKTGLGGPAKDGGSEASKMDKTNLQNIAKGENRLKDAPPVIKDGYAKMQTENPEKAQKWLSAYGQFTYLAWDPEKNDYVDKTKYKNPVGEQAASI